MELVIGFLDVRLVGRPGRSSGIGEEVVDSFLHGKRTLGRKIEIVETESSESSTELQEQKRKMLQQI